MFYLFRTQANLIKNALIIAFGLSLPAIIFACHANGICGGAVYYCQPQPIAQGIVCNCAPNYACGQYGCYKLRAHASKNLRLGQTNSQQSHLSFGKQLSSPHNRFEKFKNELQFQLPSRKSELLVELDEEKVLASASKTAAELPMRARALKDPNEAFLECCMDRQLPDACLKKCNFNYYTQQALMLMYLRQDGCPIEAMKEMQFCAAQGRDHRPCCIRNGITTTLAGAKCLTFCDQRPGQVTQLDLSFLPCFDRFENMKSCFWHDIIHYFQ
uniref:Domain of unknown function DB domain-containing protein n=1 Tax=Setaria digitata TaxID=48799 RepID=A0A915PSS4_9BILA